MEQSFGAVIFRKDKGKVLYLLLHYPSLSEKSEEYFDFAKGHPEEGESMESTVLREVEEETGIEDLVFVPGFKQRITYFYVREGKRIFKAVTFFLAKTKKKEITLSHEHKGYKWLSFEEAQETLKFKNSKNVLEKAHPFASKVNSLF